MQPQILFPRKIPPILFYCFPGSADRVSFLKFGADISQLLRDYAIKWIGTCTDNLSHQIESFNLNYKNNVAHHIEAELKPIGVP
ncbi:MAG: hypothetical protein EZS28_039519, partial [Streblomastix strix]